MAELTLPQLKAIQDLVDAALAMARVANTKNRTALRFRAERVRDILPEINTYPINA